MTLLGTFFASGFFSLYLMLSQFAVLFVLCGIKAPFYWAYLAGEAGYIEILTPIVYGVAAAFGVAILRRSNAFPATWIRVWFGAFTIGCIYVAGEEISWGQHIFGWESGDFFKLYNEQSETNLHNIRGPLKNAPKLLMEIFVLLAGVIWVVVMHGRKQRYVRPEIWSFWIYPGAVAFVAAVLAIVAIFPDRIGHLVDLDSLGYFNHGPGFKEIQELYFAFFFLLYGVTVHRRLLGQCRDRHPLGSHHRTGRKPR